MWAKHLVNPVRLRNWRATVCSLGLLSPNPKLNKPLREFRRFRPLLSVVALLVSFSFVYGKSPVVLPPVTVRSDPTRLESTRSVRWPVIEENLSPALLLPQSDDALNSLNGIQSRTQGSPTLSIRGSAQSGRSLVLYDHIPLNFSSGLGVPRLFLPKETLKSVVIVKGPASLFYGSQAMSGAIDFVSKKYLRPEININFSDTNESFLPWRRGGVGQQSYQLATPLLQTQHTHIQASLFYEDNDGQFPYQSKNISGVRDFNAENMSRLVIKGYHQEKDLRIDFNSILGRQIQQSPGSVISPLPTRQQTTGTLASISPHLFLSSQQSIKSRLSFMKTEAQFLESSTPSQNNQTTLIAQNEWIYDFNPTAKLQFFADVFSHRLDSSFIGEDLTRTSAELGPLFSFFSYKKLQHQVGGRYLLRYKKLLPSLATHYFFNKKDLWISYSEGFRNPTLSDLYANSPYFKGNTSLQAETSHQFELGIKSQNPRSQLSWDLRLFHIQYQNFLESFQLSPSVFSRRNQGSGYSQGLDLEIKKSSAFWDLVFSYNHLKTHNQSYDRPFRLSPQDQLTFTNVFKWKSLHLQVQNTHWYKTYDIYNNEVVALPDWQQWNFFLNLWLSPKTRLGFGLINAFNASKQLTFNYPEPQRKYWLQIHKQF